MDFNDLFQLHKSKTVRNTALVFTGKVIVAIISAIITIVIARSLGPKEFGIVSFFAVTAAMVTNISGFGIATAIVRYFPSYNLKDKLKGKLILKSGLKIRALLGFVVSLFGFLYSQKIAIHIFNNADLILPLRLAFIAVFAMGLEMYIRAVLQAHEKFKKIVYLGLLREIITVFFIIILLLANKLITINVIRLFVIVPFIGVLLGLLIIPKDFLRAKGDEKKSFLELIHFGKWVIITIVFVTLYSRIDIMLLTFFRGAESVGYYSAAYGLASKITLITGSIVFVLFPKFSKLTTKSKLKNYIKRSVKFTTILAVILLPIIFFAKPLVILIYGTKFNFSIDIFRILYFKFLIFLAVDHIHLIFFVTDKIKALALITIFVFIFNIIGNLIFIPIFGAIGAAYISLGTTIILSSVMYFYIKNKIKLGLIK